MHAHTSRVLYLNIDMTNHKRQISYKLFQNMRILLYVSIIYNFVNKDNNVNPSFLWQVL